MKKYLTGVIMIFILSMFATNVFCSDFKNAQEAFFKKDYSRALTLYQTALKNCAPQQNQASSENSINDQNLTLKEKISSFFYGSAPQHRANVNLNNNTNGYICLQMGRCYIQKKELDKAVSVFDMGVSLGGDNDEGNNCLYEKGFYLMYKKDYQGAYQSMKEYVKRNVDKDQKEIDPEKLRRASYAALVCAWKLNKDGINFENNMDDAKLLARKGNLFLSSNEKRTYFPKK